MTLTTSQTLITIVMLVIGTVATRALPFFLFPPTKKTPSYILYLGKVLPYAVIGLLVVFCLKSVSLTTNPFGLPEFIAIVGISILHVWRNNTLLSIGFGTLLYMGLVQFVFI